MLLSPNDLLRQEDEGSVHEPVKERQRLARIPFEPRLEPIPLSLRDEVVKRLDLKIFFQGDRQEVLSFSHSFQGSGFRV